MNCIDESAPVRAITRGPKYHWFGYYDKLEFDPTSRYVLAMEVDFEHRSPTPDDVIRIGMVDLQEDDRWIGLGESRAWCWQQGCMLQWRPGTKTQVIWNDREKDRFVCRILDVKTRRTRTLPFPIYTLSPDGRTAVGVDFGRINDVRPGYGYAGVADQNRDELAPKDSGIFRLDLETAKQELIVSLADVAALPCAHADVKGAKHWFNHLLFNPDGSRFIFLDRWPFGERDFLTRMLTASPDGQDIRVVHDYGRMSHFIWRDPRHILAWSWHPSHDHCMYLYTDGSSEVEPIGKGVMDNGHCSCLPGHEWILNDTYPDQDRNQNVYLYHVASNRKVNLGSFFAPEAYGDDEWRCDTHPRFSLDGRYVVVDSAHGGNGRQLYLIDIGHIAARATG
ncbi:MAG: hypothetical protein CMJ18_05805 [Phycisphaeraceae bacterium]|nr:hypothetical protein [Phycisphaeraceae bacterium]